MKEMKYVVTAHPDTNVEEIFIFPKSVHHDCFAEMIPYMKNQMYGNWDRVHREPISAGFTDGNTCYGVSESLGLESRPEDTKLLSM